MSKFQNILSYFHPLLLEVREGNVTPYLEVVKRNGRNVLNSQNANYSFNGLDYIFKQLFKRISLQNFRFENILVLGMGAGNAIELLRETYRIDAPITAIEKDPVVIELAKKHFNIDRHRDLTIICDDAFGYVMKTNIKYDLIISDLFVDDVVPEIFASEDYISGLRRISKKQVCVIYNKMTEQLTHKQELTPLKENFDSLFPGVKMLKFTVHGFENTVLYYNSIRCFSDKPKNGMLYENHHTKQ